MPKNTQEPTSSSVRATYPRRIWALIFRALAKYQNSEPVTGLGYEEFNENGNRWSASVSSEFASIHVYCEVDADRRAELKRRIQGLRELHETFSPKLSAFVSKGQAGYEAWEARKRELLAEQRRCERDIEKAQGELEKLGSAIDETVMLKELAGQGLLEMQVPAAAIVGFDERVSLRAAELVNRLDALDVLAEETVEAITREGLESMEYGALQTLAKGLGVNSNLKKGDLVEAIWAKRPPLEAGEQDGSGGSDGSDGSGEQVSESAGEQVSGEAGEQEPSGEPEAGGPVAPEEDLDEMAGAPAPVVEGA